MRPKTEIGRRLLAALILRGTTQEALGKLMKEDGLKSEDPQQISQGRKDMQKAHWESFARHLDVPEEWFTAPDFAAWVTTSRREGSADPAVLADADLAEALAELGEVQLQLQHVEGLLQRGELPGGGTGNA